MGGKEGILSEQKASQTAMGVAVLRAAHQLIDGEPKILDDPISVRMLDDATRARIRDHPEVYQVPHRRMLRSGVLLRSRFAEDRLAEAVVRGVSQYVMLGAGMDTFAYRQPAWASRLRVFEVDHPASQEAKRQKLAESHIETPSNVTYVEADFEQDGVRPALARSSFDMSEPAFFSCLGVLMYLTGAAARSVLAFAASTPRPSEIIFTFANQDEAGQRSIIEQNAEAHGEPWLTKYRPEELERELHGLGFSESLFLTPEMIAEHYIHDRQDDLPIPGRANIVSARV
jgi:methyltransferase (TIGR00027 family)